MGLKTNTWIIAGLMSYTFLSVAPASAQDKRDTQAQSQLQQLNSQKQKIQKMQKELNQQMQQIRKLKQQQTAKLKTPSSEQRTRKLAAHKKLPAKPKQNKSLKLGAAFVYEYQVKDHAQGNEPGGDATFNLFELNFHGQYNKFTYAAEERFSTTAFADPEYLHYGWGAYHFGKNDSQQIKGGMFQVPFGNLRYGYQSYWGNLAFYTGFTDNQAFGLGYKINDGALRIDIDAFKNDDLQQHSLYGVNPFEGYKQINGGNGRVAYTFNSDSVNTVQISAAARGGQLEVGGKRDKNGTHWAITAALDAELGQWTLQGQAVDYKYNIPSGQTFGGAALPTHSITVEEYGFGYQIPASGQLYAANLARRFDVDWGLIHSFQLYDNYGYLAVGNDGHFNSAPPGAGTNRTGDVQFNAAGFRFKTGPIGFSFDVLTGKNAAMAFDGPNDGKWHTRYNLAAALYFSGGLLN